MTLGDVIKDYRTKRGMSQRKFAEACGGKITNGYISMLENNVNPATGKPPAPSMDVFRIVADAIGMQLDEMINMIDGDQEVAIGPTGLRKVGNVNRRQVRLISKVAAGQPIPAEENWDMVDSPFDADYALTIDGDSMEPEFLDGDIVYIRAQEDVYDGGIAVVMIDNESSTLKRIYHIRNGLQLISLNPKYAPMVFLSDADEPARVRVLGVPVGYARRFHG